MTALNKQALREAAQEEIMLRCVSDTSDAWQDEASPEAVLALLDELEAAEKRIAEVIVYNVDLAEESRQYQQRIAELEAREVVLPSVQDVHPLGPQSAKIFVSSTEILSTDAPMRFAKLALT